MMCLRYPSYLCFVLATVQMLLSRSASIFWSVINPGRDDASLMIYVYQDQTFQLIDPLVVHRKRETGIDNLNFMSKLVLLLPLLHHCPLTTDIQHS